MSESSKSPLADSARLQPPSDAAPPVISTTRSAPPPQSSPPPVSLAAGASPPPISPPSLTPPPPARVTRPIAAPPPLPPAAGVAPPTELRPTSSIPPIPTKRLAKGHWWNWFRKPQAMAPQSAEEYWIEQVENGRKVPAWLVSFVAHLLLVLILAAMPLAELARRPLTLILGFSSSAGMAEFELAASDAQPQAAELAIREPVEDPGQLLQLKLPELVNTDLTKVAGNDPALALAAIPFGISSGLKGRSGELKSALLSKFGGSSETEEAVELGLQWLAAQQKGDGSWSLTGPYSDGGVTENATAATALALNAFLGAGSTHKEGKYRDVVQLGLRYLLDKQNSQGYFPDEREPSRQQMYAQAIASITVAEAYGMTGDADLAPAAQRAMNFAEWSQSKLRGWRYEPRQDADLSVTGWFVMALSTGKMAGLKVDEAKLQQVAEFLDSVSYEEQSRYAYANFEPPSLSMTAEGLLCRIYLGWPRTHPALLRAIKEDLLTSPPRLGDEAISVYYWYYATQVLHHVGGKQWQSWNQAMKSVLPALQVKEERELGSWSPNNDMFGASGGRLYTTCLNLYCLEVYYRHLSIYEIP